MSLNLTLARQLFGDSNPIGEHLRMVEIASVNPWDPLTFPAVIIHLLLATVSAAAGIPAWRAANVDPSVGPGQE